MLTCLLFSSSSITIYAQLDEINRQITGLSRFSLGLTVFAHDFNVTQFTKMAQDYFKFAQKRFPFYFVFDCKKKFVQLQIY